MRPAEDTRRRSRIPRASPRASPGATPVAVATSMAHQQPRPASSIPGNSSVLPAFNRLLWLFLHTSRNIFLDCASKVTRAASANRLATKRNVAPGRSHSTVALNRSQPVNSTCNNWLFITATRVRVWLSHYFSQRLRKWPQHKRKFSWTKIEPPPPKKNKDFCVSTFKFQIWNDSHIMVWSSAFFSRITTFMTFSQFTSEEKLEPFIILLYKYVCLKETWATENVIKYEN